MSFGAKSMKREKGNAKEGRKVKKKGKLNFKGAKSMQKGQK
jgi:hypothetical protein